MNNPTTISPLRQRMIEDMYARKLNPLTQKGHLRACRRFAQFLRRSPDTASPDDVRRFQLQLIEDGASISTRNRTMTGLRFLFRVTLPVSDNRMREGCAWTNVAIGAHHDPKTNDGARRSADPRGILVHPTARIGEAVSIEPGAVTPMVASRPMAPATLLRSASV